MSAPRPTRVVLLVPWGRERTRQLGQLYAYAAEQGLVVDSVAASLPDALEAITAGLADIVLVADTAPLAPLIVIASEAPPPDPPSIRSGTVSDVTVDAPPMRRRPKLIR